MQRYFADIVDNNIVLKKDDIFHIVTVMRNGAGDKIHIVANKKTYLATIVSTNPFSFKINNEIVETHEINGKIRLLYCLPKGEKLDLVIQKAVELGVSEIVLVQSSRCVRKIEKDNFSNKLVRFNKIIKEASEQSRRSELAKLVDLIDFKDIIKYKADISFIAYENCKSSLANFGSLLKNSNGKTINILIGSEGGFSEDEVEYCAKNGYEVISLGNRILRSETSCIYALSLISFFMESGL